MTPQTAASLELLRRFAPGTALRTAAELIMAQGTGALILIGSGAKIDRVMSGGFLLDNANFTAQRLAELAKMDGGIVVDEAVIAAHPFRQEGLHARNPVLDDGTVADW